MIYFSHMLGLIPDKTGKPHQFSLRLGYLLNLTQLIEMLTLWESLNCTTTRLSGLLLFGNLVAL